MRELPRLPRLALPSVILGIGVLLALTVVEPTAAALRAPLATLPPTLVGHEAVPRSLSAAEIAWAKSPDYVLRDYERDGQLGFALYVAYYDVQQGDRSIHSPKNCLPGSGWEPLSSEERIVRTAGGTLPVNRFLLAHKEQRALAYYWYQGRGRAVANEYAVKAWLLWDALTARRTEEALVRIVVPVDPDPADGPHARELAEARADSLAVLIASRVAPEVERVLPLR
jgi:EpsI family protein